MNTLAPIDNPSQDMADAENINPKRARKTKKPPKKITEKYLYNSGLAYLQHYTSSVPNFRRVMTKKIDKSCNFHKEQDRAACLALLDNTVAAFERQGLLNDAAYTQGMVTSLRRRGLSARAIQYKLQQKGLAEDAIQEALQAFDGDSDADLVAATRLMRRKRFGPFGPPLEDEKIRNRQLAAFARGGFAFDIAYKAMALTQEEAETLLSRHSY